MDWWRNKVEAMHYAAELRDAHELDKAAAELRESNERAARRAQQSAVPAQLDVRRAVAKGREVRPEVAQRARIQDLSAGLVARLQGSQGSNACPKCEAVVMASAAKCPACHQVLIDERGHRRAGLRTVG